MFRDESQGLIAKARRGKTSQRSASASDGAASRQKPPRSANEGQSNVFASVPVGLTTSPEDQATTFFFQNYVPGRNEFRCGSFQYLQDMYHQEKIGQAVADLVVSVGIAGLSNFWKAPQFMATAKMKYTSALRLLSSHLRNVNEAKADQTFAAVMLLVLYETNGCHSRRATETGMEHTLGASALMQLRGKKQLRTKIGRELFIHYRSQAISNCIQRNSRVPSFITEWNEALNTTEPIEAAADSIAQMYMKYADLRREMGPTDGFSNPENIISRCLALNAECEQWVESCPLQYAHQTVKVNAPSEEVFRDEYHVYSSPWIAMTWNNFRALRICIHDLLRKYLKHFYQLHPVGMLFHDPNFFRRQTLVSEEIILKCSTDICSSVPYFLGFQPDLGAVRPMPGAFKGNLLLWPLYNAGCMDVIPNHQRNWVVGRLRYISEVMLIRQATPLVNVLTEMAIAGAWDDLRCNTGEDNVLENGGPAAVQTTTEQVQSPPLYTIHDSLVLRSQSQEYQDTRFPDPLEQTLSYSPPMQQQPVYQLSTYQNRPNDFQSSVSDRHIFNQTRGMAMSGDFESGNW
ncbi:uncharacterized protein BP5553_09902 [Venustampulla echinocandica]|uniref:Transcription factor domain-containing protein n=1 Tax=Venustampulla echinocandica TaxID=2656787 RepID=A0A370TAZ3_9HELO|nr:uncharacterized protein BP5553_09902 [Venustampulla echinocandica]RDL31113.1 hypothetical protein BP5553_09902 [Venustampulla echinocandica]